MLTAAVTTDTIPSFWDVCARYPRRFRIDETVLVGEIERRLPENHSHATQLGLIEYASAPPTLV